jgi:hypothetical protein
MSMADVGRDFLEHYGVKGMKWGVRKKSGSSKGGPASDDAKRHAANKKKKVSELSDRELKDLANRLNTEQQVARLTANGESAVKKILSAGNTLNTAISLLRSPAGQAVIAVGTAAAVRLIRTSGAVGTIGQFGK